MTLFQETFTLINFKNLCIPDRNLVSNSATLPYSCSISAEF